MVSRAAHWRGLPSVRGFRLPWACAVPAPPGSTTFHPGKLWGPREGVAYGVALEPTTPGRWRRRVHTLQNPLVGPCPAHQGSWGGVGGYRAEPGRSGMGVLVTPAAGAGLGWGDGSPTPAECSVNSWSCCDPSNRGEAPQAEETSSIRASLKDSVLCIRPALEP